MHLKRPLPPGRTLQSVRNHYLVEREIARRIMSASREERTTLYASMYDELFSKVPDHPRLTRRIDDRATDESNRIKLSLVGRFLGKSKVFLEYAPGDCRFVIDIAKRVKHAYGLDISDQRRPGETKPPNFDLVIYDGYSLDEIASDSIDVIFSDQLIEHFHPEDTRLHFELAHRLLTSDGIYVFRTPHSLTGPHDVSMHFSDVPECFHLKEWTYGEIQKMLMDIGFSSFHAYWHRYGKSVRLPNYFFIAVEKVLQSFPKRRIRRIAQYAVPQVYGVAVK